MYLNFIYSIGIFIASVVLKITAPFNNKIRKGVNGRKQTFSKLEDELNSTDKTLWFHCASLGEYEQGKPVFEILRRNYPDYKIILTFFSPSGYEVRHNSEIADVVVYLPLDTKKNAKRFLNIIKPEYTIFVKYEIWPNFLYELKKRDLNSVLISAVFRPEQSFFKWYGGYMKTSLEAFNHIFTQDHRSKTLLEGIGFKNITVSGDTRFDRVSNQLSQDNTLEFIEQFKNKQTCLVFGSTWPDDDKLYFNFINSEDNRSLKYIIAPHNIKPSYVASIKSQLKVSTICYSDLSSETDLGDYQVFILDTIGLLSKAYHYADIAYVGGAAGRTGLHNILEPAVFGIPVLIGDNYHKFPEAKQLIELGGVTSVSTAIELSTALSLLINDDLKRKNQGQINASYISKNQGAVIQILNYIRI